MEGTAVGLKKHKELEIFGQDSGYGCGEAYGNDNGFGEGHCCEGYGNSGIDGHGLGSGFKDGGYGTPNPGGSGFSHEDNLMDKPEYVREGRCYAVFNIPKEGAWRAYHVLEKASRNRYLVYHNCPRGQLVDAGEEVHEKKVKLGLYGFHAYLSPKDAYAPIVDERSDYALAKILIWGEVHVGRDSVAAECWKIVGEMKDIWEEW